MKGRIMRDEKPWRPVLGDEKPWRPVLGDKWSPVLGDKWPSVRDDPPCGEWIKCPRCWEMHKIEGRTTDGIWWWCGRDVGTQGGE